MEKWVRDGKRVEGCKVEVRGGGSRVKELLPNHSRLTPFQHKPKVILQCIYAKNSITLRRIINKITAVTYAPGRQFYLEKMHLDYFLRSGKGFPCKKNISAAYTLTLRYSHKICTNRDDETQTGFRFVL